jgi:RHS repeat-associated protein
MQSPPILRTLISTRFMPIWFAPIGRKTAAGSVCYEADFYPFGGERDITSTCTPTYKFEGKERDTETNNDDFGARYYSSQFGRWTSPDWSSMPAPVPYANLTNPQTLNLYAMVSDNPESFADLDGHCPPCDVEGPPASTMEEIDEVVKPLIESASAEAGPIIGGILRGVAVGAAVVVELATSPASNANEKQLLSQANAKQAESEKSSAEPQAQAACGGKGTIYKVPGSATASGKPYIGLHNKPNPAKTRKSKDGRDRTKAKVVDTYNASDTQEGRTKEQQQIDQNGGVSNLDNKRNEIHKEPPASEPH